MKYIDAEKLIAEIERRIKEDYNGPDKHDNEIAQGVCASIIAFLDTLPKEKPSEESEVDYENIARHFAEWQKNKMLEKAICTEVGITCGIPSIWLALKDCKQGDTVKVIIIKED